jgi:hypothetical protein
MRDGRKNGPDHRKKFAGKSRGKIRENPGKNSGKIRTKFPENRRSFSGLPFSPLTLIYARGSKNLHGNFEKKQKKFRILPSAKSGKPVSVRV